MNLEAITFNGRQGYIRVHCPVCGVDYDVRQVEEYTHAAALHVAQFVCPEGHLCEGRRIWVSA